ncbi:lipoate--protein ligase family protein [Halapricum sp. CBA1109]|uniref:lipoyl protein ligase domain-containing protein n=1 Tax=Halapricum sp. CBA1109 TaxID=2668068 RepID=UPI0012FC4EAF|nr:lipoate--protein ligase family protein [Halapricum sp. CBA1109]MUV90290.1 lipoate--protein ligase family protein [Halapricum sp. CBA1109]
MFVRRGPASTVADDRTVTETMLDRVAAAGEAGLRVWYPPKQVAFGRRDERAEGYEAARAAARERGFPTVTRDVGGRAVVFTGSTLAFVHAVPAEGRRGDIRDRYADALDRLRAALSACGVETTADEPDDAFCPGSHSLSAGGKVAGLAQRVTQAVAVVAGAVVVADREAFVTTTAAVYEALGVAFDPESTTSLVAAGCPAGPDRVADAVVAAFLV